MRVTENWNRLLKEAVESPPLELFKSDLVTALSAHPQVTLLELHRSLPTSTLLWMASKDSHQQTLKQHLKWICPAFSGSRKNLWDRSGRQHGKENRKVSRERKKTEEKWNDIENSYGQRSLPQKEKSEAAVSSLYHSLYSTECKPFINISNCWNTATFHLCFGINANPCLFGFVFFLMSEEA